MNETTTPTTYTACHSCSAGLTNADWTHVDDGALAGIMAMVEEAGLICMASDEPIYGDCEFCQNSPDETVYVWESVR